MANREHLRILKQGAEVWNKWRHDNPTIRPGLINANFNNQSLRFMNLSYADLSYANLIKTDLISANLTNAELTDANLRDANLRYANLSKANLINANLNHTIVTHAKFNDAILGNTSFADTDLTEAAGLETAMHRFPSEVGINTIYLSRGKIPEVFLRGCGVPENFIIYIHSLTGQALEFYKCFISFTEADDLFSERLYNDLQAKGVRCWRWKEDAKWGETLMRSIDEAVRYYDKLIIICSEQSLNSPAVIREIERALQKEDDMAREGKDAEVLFPIRLDDHIFTGWNHHRKADIIAKNVGDFRLWNEPEKYKKAFNRLLRDLKAKSKQQTAEG